MVQSELLLKYKEINHYFFDRKDSTVFPNYQSIINKCIFAEQVHGNKTVFISNGKKFIPKADGLMTDKLPQYQSRLNRDGTGFRTIKQRSPVFQAGESSLFLGIRTADCLPIFFVDYEKQIIAAVHAGWKGLFSGIIESALTQFRKRGSNVKNIVSVIGPHIGICCYNVPYDRVLEFKKRGINFDTAVVLRKSKWYLDLGRIAYLTIRNCGLFSKNIDMLSICTYCDNRFFSYRREKSSPGRNYSVIGAAQRN